MGSEIGLRGDARRCVQKSPLRCERRPPHPALRQAQDEGESESLPGIHLMPSLSKHDLGQGFGTLATGVSRRPS